KAFGQHPLPRPTVTYEGSTPARPPTGADYLVTNSNSNRSRNQRFGGISCEANLAIPTRSTVATVELLRCENARTRAASSLLRLPRPASAEGMRYASTDRSTVS